MFQEKLPRKYGFKLVCKICFRGKKVQTAPPAKGKRCPTHDGDWDPLQVHQTSLMEIRPMPTVKDPQGCRFRLCQYNQDGKCEQKDKCSYPHNQHELHVWKAEQAIRYPRPNPQRQSTNIPQLCVVMSKEKKVCERGQLCFGAHSIVELTMWQLKHQKTKQDPKTRGESSQYVLINLTLHGLSIT